VRLANKERTPQAVTAEEGAQGGGEAEEEGRRV